MISPLPLTDALHCVYCMYCSELRSGRDPSRNRCLYLYLDLDLYLCPDLYLHLQLYLNLHLHLCLTTPTQIAATACATRCL